MKISWGLILGFFCMGLTLSQTSWAEADVKSKKEQLIAEFIQISYRPLVDMQLAVSVQQTRQAVRPGQTFQGQDISTEKFWQTVLSEYELQKDQLRSETYTELQRFLSKKFSEGELEELLKMLNSDVFMKMVGTGMDPENPVKREYLGKKIRKNIYKIVHQKVKEANLNMAQSAPDKASGRTPASAESDK